MANKTFLAMLLSCFSYFCFLAADLSFANQIDYRQAGLDFGSNYKNSGSLVVNSQNQVNTPGFTTDNPKQTKYYSDISNGDMVQWIMMLKTRFPQLCKVI